VSGSGIRKRTGATAAANQPSLFDEEGPEPNQSDGA
jgi:hypothetical protein